MTIRDHLQAIYDAHGTLTPELVVKTARPKTHPLHSHVFDRKPDAAAEAWYRYRAHELIQSVRVVYRAADDDEPLDVRAFHAVRREEGYAYEPVEKVVEDAFTTKLLLADMEREWRQLKDRYDRFKEFWALVRGEAA